MNSAKLFKKPIARVYFLGKPWKITGTNLVKKQKTCYVHKHKIFFLYYLHKPKSLVPKGTQHEIFDEDIRSLNNFPLTQRASNSVPFRMSQSKNRSRLSSAHNECYSAQAGQILKEELEVGFNSHYAESKRK